MDSEEITTEFFKRRFPEKNLDFEKKCGYFQEWAGRFDSGYPESFMDSESLRIWSEMQADFCPTYHQVKIMEKIQ